jgi:hypothetical protein
VALRLRLTVQARRDTGRICRILYRVGGDELIVVGIMRCEQDPGGVRTGEA